MVLSKYVAVRLAVPLFLAAAAGAQVRLPNHVPDALPGAIRLPRNPRAAAQPITLTFMLNWSDAPGFEIFRGAFEDPGSPAYHQAISRHEFQDRFGPTQAAYDSVLSWLQQQGLTLLEGSKNRITLTVRGTRAQAERLLDVHIDDYRLGASQFHANDTDPTIPSDLAPLVRSVTGLSDLARPHRAASPSPRQPVSYLAAYNAAGVPANITGQGQGIGLVELDAYNQSDVVNWLSFAGLPANLINQVFPISVAGGTSPSGGIGESEVLVDIAAVLGMAPGATVAVYEAPQGTSILTVLNAAIVSMNDDWDVPGGIVSTSWSECEDQLSGSDLDSIDSLLAHASSIGLTVFSASGDFGNTCVDGSGNSHPGKINAPSDSPHAVAVGGTTLQVAASNSWLSESWWTNGNDGTFGNGGYGVSGHFSMPAYQAPFTATSGRSVPDVVADAGDGINICQGVINGTPNCFNIVGTSVAAPMWAGMWALANQASIDAGRKYLAAGDGTLYSSTDLFAYHNIFTGAGNTFSHIGLGSPNITALVGAFAPPSITAISPSTGPSTGGTTVTLNGVGLIGVFEVNFDNNPATSFQVVSDRQLTAVSPACTSLYCPLSQTVSVRTPGGTASINFNYIPLALPTPQCGGSPSCDGTLRLVCANVPGADFRLDVYRNGQWVTVSTDNDFNRQVDAQLVAPQSGTYRVCTSDLYNSAYYTCASSFNYSTSEMNRVLQKELAATDPVARDKIISLEKDGLFGKGKPWERNRYPSDYMIAAWGDGYFPYLYQRRPDANYDPIANGVMSWDLYREMWGSHGEFVIDGNLKSVEYGDRLQTITVPTLITAGDHDESDPVQSKEMQQKIAGSKLVILPDSGHMTFVDQPALYLKAVGDFLK